MKTITVILALLACACLPGCIQRVEYDGLRVISFTIGIGALYVSDRNLQVEGEDDGSDEEQ